MSSLILKSANEFSNFFIGTSRSDDSAGDRLSYRYTSAILIAFTIIVSNREFTKKRIQCWVPAFFNGNYEDYTNEVCWVRNTYYVHDDKEIPESMDARQELSIRYYQWIQFILLFQALFFFLPYVLWRSLCLRSGIDIRDLVEAATNYKKATDENKRNLLMNYMLSIIDQYVDDPRRQSNNRERNLWRKFIYMIFPSSGRYLGDYLRNLFIFVKIIYILNVFAQILLLSFLLGQPFWLLGFTIIRFLYEGRGWDYQSRYFPKVTLCDFQIREANALKTFHTYTVMCVLPTNLFNQQIFTFLWFWFVIVIIFTIYDLFIWIYRLFFRCETYLTGRLVVMNHESVSKWPFNNYCVMHINEAEYEHFTKVLSREESATTGDEVYQSSDGRKIHTQSRMYIVPRIYYEKKLTLFDYFNLEYLEPDGHFILRMIGTNASDFVATQILYHLYELCCKKRFRPHDVEENAPKSRTTLTKYIILPHNNTSNASSEKETETTNTSRVNPATEIQQQSMSSSQISTAECSLRVRSGTLPFIQPIQTSQKISTEQLSSSIKHDEV